MTEAEVRFHPRKQVLGTGRGVSAVRAVFHRRSMWVDMLVGIRKTSSGENGLYLQERLCRYQDRASNLMKGKRARNCFYKAIKKIRFWPLSPFAEKICRAIYIGGGSKRIPEKYESR